MRLLANECCSAQHNNSEVSARSDAMESELTLVDRGDAGPVYERINTHTHNSERAREDNDVRCSGISALYSLCCISFFERARAESDAKCSE